MSNNTGRTEIAAADLFSSTGIFVWYQALARLVGAVSPARAIFAVAQCLQRLHDRPLALAAATGPEAVGRVLERFRDSYERVPLSSDVENWGPADTGWWQPREHLGHLMSVHCGEYMLHNGRRRLREHGLKVDYVELHDLAAMFANEHLDSAVRSFDPCRGEGKEAPWITTVFVRYALPRASVLKASRTAFDQVLEVPVAGADPVEVLDELQQQDLLEELQAQLAGLPEVQRRALQLYFGFRTHEHTLAEVATELGCSVHLARLSITSGMGALASSLRADAIADDNDLKVARLVFAEGLDATVVAGQLGLTPADVRRRAKRVGLRFRSSFRLRTVRDQPATTEDREFSMALRTRDHADVQAGPDAGAADDGAMQELLRYLDFVEGLRPQARAGRGFDWRQHTDLSDRPARLDSHLKIQLQHVWHHLSTVRQARSILATRIDLYGRLEDALVELGAEELLSALFAPTEDEIHTRRSRDDLPPDHREWSQLLQRQASGYRRQSEDVVRLYLGAREAVATEAERTQWPDRVMAVYGTTLALLQEQMPWAHRARRQARLRLWHDDAGAVLCAWVDDDGKPGTAFPLAGVLAQQLRLVGRFDAADAAGLSRLMARHALQAAVPMPGFEAAVTDDAGAVLMSWMPEPLRLASAEPAL